MVLYMVTIYGSIMVLYIIKVTIYIYIIKKTNNGTPGVSVNGWELLSP